MSIAHSPTPQDNPRWTALDMVGAVIALAALVGGLVVFLDKVN